MGLPIPRRYIPEINKIRSLSDSGIDELVRALESSPITSDPEKLAKNIAANVPTIKPSDLVGIVEFIYGVYHVRDFSELNRRVFLDELVAGIIETAKLRPAESDISILRDRFKRILSVKSLNTISKATNLQRAGERLFCSATITSDLRPVFGQDVKSKPVAAVITHTLKVVYHGEGGHRSFFLILDDEDLSKLEDTNERDKKKSETLKSLLEDMKLPRLGV
jgi:hypothetical protein